ncbi:MAG: hypothetical protein JO204_19465 [Alphaproteobacteria bacterium]|nr:hypothetical protein [Alphaproteobacteria bacterium]
MSAITRVAAPVTAPTHSLWAQRVRAIRHRLLAALDRLVPPPDRGRYVELPAEWFKYPPF